MQCTDTNGDGKIQYEEFVHWIQSSDGFDMGLQSVATSGPPPTVDLPSELIFLQGRESTWLRAGSDPHVAFSVDDHDVLLKYFEMHDEDLSETLSFDELTSILRDLCREPKPGTKEMKIFEKLRALCIQIHGDLLDF